MSERDEINRLKKENHELKKKLYRLEMELSADKEAAESENNNDCFKANNYFSFLLAKVKRKNFYSSFEKFSKYFRNSMLVTRIFRYGLLLYQYLQAGAFFIIYAAAFILFIPITLATSLVTLIVTLILRDRNRRTLLKQLKKDVVFVIPSSKEAFDRIEIEQEIEKHEGCTVLLVTPFFFKKTGIGENKKMFVCYRRERDDIYIMRRYFFFYFRKRMRKEQTFNTKEIYLSDNR